MSTRFITVATFNFSHDAHMAKNKLEAEGIPCLIADEFTIAMDWFYANALGGIKVQVPVEKYEEALFILNEDYSDDLSGLSDMDLDEETDDIFDEFDSIQCPYCHSTDSELVESDQQESFLSRLTFGMVHPPSTKKYKCHICLNEWIEGEI